MYNREENAVPSYASLIKQQIRPSFYDRRKEEGVFLHRPFDGQSAILMSDDMSGLSDPDKQDTEATATEDPSQHPPEPAPEDIGAPVAELSESEQTESPEAPSSDVDETEAFEEPTASDEYEDEDEDSDSDESEEAPPTPESSEDAGSSPQPTERRRRSGYDRGELIDVVIQEVSPTLVVVELDERGDGFRGIIPGRELERMSAEMIEELVVGEKVTLFVVNNGDKKGDVVLSLNRALEAMDWQEAEKYKKSRDVYEGFIAGYNKGGLIVRFGRLRGFVPQSQISEVRRRRLAGDTPEARWGDMVRESISVKVIEVDRSRNRLILSERAAARETREKRKARLIEELELNEVRTGRVVSLEDFGAFVDVGGAEGLVHLTELSWGHVTHPRQVVSVGDEITVEVINIDPDRKRIGLSLKRQLSDPWDIIATDYSQGQLVQAEVTKLTKFGAFAQLVDTPEVEGLIHISELSDDRVAHPKEVVNVGERLTLRIVKIDVPNRRLGLSLKRVNSTEYLDDDMDFLFGEDE